MGRRFAVAKEALNEPLMVVGEVMRLSWSRLRTNTCNARYGWRMETQKVTFRVPKEFVDMTSAVSLGAGVGWSEGLNAGRRFGTLAVLTPFN